MNSRIKLLAAVVGAAALAGCDSITTADESTDIPGPTSTVVIGGTVTGLGTVRPVQLTMVTTNNGKDGINDGTQVFNVRGTEVLRFGSVGVGANYTITVTGSPAGRTCTIANGSGTATAEVSNVAVTCARDSTPLYTVTADIAPALSGAPPEGFAVTLTTEEGSETVQPTAGQSSVTFTLPVFYPASTSPPPFAYTVTATNSVGGTTNRCLVNGATGSLVLPAPTDAVPNPVGANISTGITVASCLYTISAVAQYSAPPGGVASAMGAGGLQLGLRNQLTDNIDAQAPLISGFSATAVAFPGNFAANSQSLYEVVVESHPDGQFCIVQGGGLAQLVSANANVTVQVRCRDIPVMANQLQGVYQLDAPPRRENDTDDWNPGDLIPEPRVPTRNFMTFFPNGTFIYGTHHATATTGVEHGFYNYNPVASTLGFTVWTDTNGTISNSTLTFTSFAPGFTSGSGTAAAGVNATAGLSGRLGYSAPFTQSFTTFAVTYFLPGNVTATNVVRTPGSPGVPGTISMQFGAFIMPPVAPATTPAANLNNVWTMTEPVSTAGEIQGAWTTADSKRVFVYNKTTYYGFHAGLNGAPNLQDACFTILNAALAESFYTRRGGDTGCMTTANAEIGTVGTGTVDVPNATTTNTTAPLIPGFTGRLPGSTSNAVSSPSPVNYSVVSGTPDTLTIQGTLNGNPIGFPVVLSRATTY